MASFYQDPNPTSDPDYAKASKEPERVQADTSLGTLFSGIGDVAKNTGAALGTIFDTKIKKDAQDIINPIRNDAGAGLSLDTVQDIAGTGAKGRVRALQMRQGAGAVDGTDDASGVLGFAPNDASVVQQQTAGIFAGVDQPAKELPPDAQQEITQINRMQQAYRSGNLSDSSYSAQLLAGASKLKARYPGFEDEVDSAFEKITGQNSANSIRKSLMQDIQYNQAAMLGAQGEDQKFRNKYRDVAAGLGYDPDSTPMEVLRPAVNKELGTTYNLTSKKQAAEVGSVEAEQTLQDTLAHGARTSLVSLSNQSQGKSGLSLPDFVKQAQEMTLRGGGTPKEIDALVTQMEFAKQKAMNDARAQAYQAIPGRADGHTSVSLLGANADQRFTSMLTNQYKPWDDAIALVKSGNMSALQQQTDSMKYADNADVITFKQKFPGARFLAAVNTSFPGNPVFVNRLLETSSLLPQFQAQATNISNAILNGNKDMPAPKPSEALDAYGRGTKEPTAAEIANGARPWTDADRAQAAKIARQTVKQYNMVISPDNKNEPNSTHVAKQFFQDTKFYDDMNDSGRLKLFMTMASPEKTAFIDKLSANDSDVRGQYENWVKRAAGDIWRRNSADLQSAITDKRLDLQYNDKSGQFTDGTKYDVDVVSQNWKKHNQQTIQSINNVTNILKPIVGNGNPTAILDTLGIDPTEPKAQGVLQSIAKGIGDKFTEWSEGDKREDIKAGRVPAPKSTPAPDGTLEPQQTRGVIQGNVSDSNDTAVDNFAIPPGMTPGEFIAELKRRHQL